MIDVKTLTRPIYADNALTTIKNHQPLSIFTIRETSFDPIEGDLAAVESEAIEGDFAGKTKVLREDKTGGD